jgi:hypothetical protein
MRGHCILGAAAVVMGALSPLAALPAEAAETNATAASTPASRPAETDAERVKELEKRLDQRDAVIRDLQQRVERLERGQTAHVAVAPPAPGPAPAQAQTAQASKPAPPPTGGGSQAVAQAAPPRAPPTAPPAAAQGTAPGSAQGAPAPPGPGQFTVSEEAAQHALERALVQSGAALLPRGKFEFVPSLIFQYQRVSTPGQIALTPQGAVLISENLLRNTQVQGQALLRAGLPFNSQLEIALPWSYRDSDVITRVGGAGLSETGVNGFGVGDLAIALTKQILTDTDQHPGLFANIGWNSNYGDVKGKLPLGTGFTEWSAGLTAVKRQDPLVFTASFAYIYTVQNKGVKPGEQYIPTFGILLAVSPETSLQIGQQFIFQDKFIFNGRAIPGSNRTEGILSVGLLSILGRGRVINVSVGFGETPDTPNVIFQVSMPLRLN